MTLIPFSKFHGFGNDYIVIEARHIENTASIPALAEKICARHTGAGADGIAIIEKLDGADADYSCRIINPDGSEVAFSGNGTRCAAAYLSFNNLWREPVLRLQTLSGIKIYTLLARDEKTFEYSGALGKPKFSSAEIPFAAAENLAAVEDFWLPLETGAIKIMALNVGNPVAAIFTESFEAFDWRAVGCQIESHALFPEKTNVVFIKPADDENIEIRIWERGAGETSSSGTCSAAAAIAHLRQHGRRGPVCVHAPGGTTEIEWREADGEMIIRGTANFIYTGEWRDANI